jgi:hypothetical protein
LLQAAHVPADFIDDAGDAADHGAGRFVPEWPRTRPQSHPEPGSTPSAGRARVLSVKN